MTVTIDGIDGIKARAGEHLGASDWFTVDQARINLFADATDDNQWIHVDVERAAAGPFGGPIAHGFLTLSLVVPLWESLVSVDGISMAINYGLNKVRFPVPVPAGGRIRLSATLGEVRDVPGGIEATVDMIVELEGGEKPACVAQAVHRYLA